MGVCMCIFVDGTFSEMIYSWELHTKKIFMKNLHMNTFPSIKIYFNLL